MPTYVLFVLFLWSALTNTSNHIMAWASQKTWTNKLVNDSVKKICSLAHNTEEFEQMHLNTVRDSYGIKFKMEKYVLCYLLWIYSLTYKNNLT
jgi:hypothetical protein